MTEPLEFDIRMSREDFVSGAALLVRAKVRLWMPYFFTLLPLIYLALQLVTYGPAAFRDPHNLGVFAIGAAIVALVPAIGAPLLVPRAIKAAARKQYDRMPDLAESAHYTFDTQGFTVRTPAEMEENAWADLHDAMTDGRVLLLRRTPTLAYTLPLEHIAPDTRTPLFDLIAQAGKFHSRYRPAGVDARIPA